MFYIKWNLSLIHIFIDNSHSSIPFNLILSNIINNSSNEINTIREP